MTLVVEDVHLLTEMVGESLGTSPAVEITQSMIDGFAEATEISGARRAEQVSTTIDAFGRDDPSQFLLLSLCAEFLAQIVQVEGATMTINYGLDGVRFNGPIASNATVRGRALLACCEPISGGVQTLVHMAIEANGKDEPVCVASMVMRYYVNHAA
jgi:hypothetical protein